MRIKFYFINENNILIPVYHNIENVFEIILFLYLKVRIKIYIILRKKRKN